MSLRTWHRILICNAPFELAIEIFLRTVVVYLFLITAVRVLGKRMSGQITNLELGVMLTLGAIVSVPMESAERGVVPGLVLLCCIVLIQRAFSTAEARSPRFARLLLGKTSALLVDGVLLPDALERAHVSQQQLLSVLRGQHVRHLGEIERVYLEQCGAFSVLRRAQPVSGLSVIPDPDAAIQQQARSGLVCAYCGQRAPAPENARCCQNCKHTEWTEPSQASGSASS